MFASQSLSGAETGPGISMSKWLMLAVVAMFQFLLSL